MNARETHKSSIRQLRQERLQADTRAENLRLQLKAADSKLQRALRRFVRQRLRLVFSHKYYTINISPHRIKSEVRSKELTTRKLHALQGQHQKISAKMNARETHKISIRQLRQERLQADTRAENLRLQLKAALHELDVTAINLDTTKEELHVTLKR